MKKLIYGAAIALALGAVACNKSDDSTSEAKFFSQEATDSLLTTFGSAAGNALNQQITNAMMQDSTISKEAFLRGLQYAMAADTTNSYMNGMITGLQIQTQLKRFEAMGLKVDRSLALNAFKTAFLDSVASQFVMAQAEQQYRQWTDSLMNAKKAYDLAQLEATPEAQENLQKGESYIKAMKASNDSVKISADGLGYKIVNAGEGDKIKPTDRVSLTYTARTVGGRVIEQFSATPMFVGSRIQGLQEGLGMLGKGGKATFYVPGKLGYGVEVPQRYDLGLNELLIYEVEVMDVMNAPTQPQQPQMVMPAGAPQPVAAPRR